MFYTYNENKQYSGMTELQPKHENWTEIEPIGCTDFMFFNGKEWIEKKTIEQTQELIAGMRIKYDELIDELVRVPIQKKLLRNIEIPQAIKDEAERLRLEYYTVTNQTPPKETTPLVSVNAKIK